MKSWKFLLGILAAGSSLLVLSAEPKPVRNKSLRNSLEPARTQMVPANATISKTADSQAAVAETSPPKAILVLETRTHRITVYGAENAPRYSVATVEGSVLADLLSPVELKDRFPELYDVVTGLAWAGLQPQLR
jgi:hypothetical protein